ncbi:MAG: flagellar hook-associated 2 protein, partial [Firmicutes bacterium]|nr:flagellar hook-associated 2 protein [Bacillota bacterium]
PNVGVLKIPGMVTGLDTENLIKTLMAVERKPVDALQKQSDTLTPKASAWRDLNQRLLTLQKRMEDIKNVPASAWDARQASVSDASVLTATAQSTAIPGSFTVEVTALAKSTILQQGLMNNGTANTPVADPTAALNLAAGGTIVVSSGAASGKTFAIKATDSLNDIANTINANKDTLGFSASVVQVSPGDHRLVLTGKNGTANDFTLDDAAGSTVGAALGLVTGKNIRVDTAANTQAKVNGVAVSSADNTLTNAIPGTTLTLQKTTTSPVTVTLSKDSSQVAGAVKAFVDQYNSVIDFIGQLTSYDSKTKQAGTLLGDDRINPIGQSLRTKVFDSVQGVAADANSLAMVGVGMESFTAGQSASGKLTFDQAKFTAAMEKNPNAVRDLFTVNTVDSTGAPVKGLALRTAEWLDNYTKTGGIVLGQATTIDQQITDISDRIKVYNEQLLPMREQRLRNQYTALEKAMSTFQNQGSWLTSQLKSLP